MSDFHYTKSWRDFVKGGWHSRLPTRSLPCSCMLPLIGESKRPTCKGLVRGDRTGWEFITSSRSYPAYDRAVRYLQRMPTSRLLQHPSGSGRTNKKDPNIMSHFCITVWRSVGEESPAYPVRQFCALRGTSFYTTKSCVDSTIPSSFSCWSAEAPPGSGGESALSDLSARGSLSCHRWLASRKAIGESIRWLDNSSQLDSNHSAICLSVDQTEEGLGQSRCRNDTPWHEIDELQTGRVALRFSSCAAALFSA